MSGLLMACGRHCRKRIQTRAKLTVDGLHVSRPTLTHSLVVGWLGQTRACMRTYLTRMQSRMREGSENLVRVIAELGRPYLTYQY